MARVSLGVLSGIFALTLGAAAPDVAHAGIDSCGNIHVEADAYCEVVAATVECESMCTPLSVRAACSAQLAAECKADCDDLPSVECSGSCEADCMAECTDFEPGEFDCEVACEADCMGRCEASCEASDDSASCMASCEGSCTASCDGSCDVELPEADCDASCEASCEGSCEADANFDCQIDCQGELYAECETDIEGGCEIDCESEEGALFCDGNYVDHGGNLEMCIDAIEAAIDIEVEASSSGEASCDEGVCRAEGEAMARVSSDCAVARPGAHGSSSGVVALLLGLAGLLPLRRRRRR